jgi:transposase
VIVDHTNRRVLDVLESREKECVARYLRQGQEGGLLGGVVEVTCDMWDAYANAATEVFGTGCRVVIDRFHVMKNFQEQLTDARREIQRGLGKEEAKALKGTRWLWVKNWENLTAQERVELESLKERFPPLKQLAEQRERLRAIFEDKEIRDAEEGRKQLQAWMAEAEKLALKGLKAFCKTLANWMDKVAGGCIPEK